MENSSCKKICRFCLEMLDSNFETIEEVTFANLDLLWLKLNLTISEEPVMCGDCATTIKSSSDFKAKCLEIENCIMSSVKDKDSIKFDLRRVYVMKVSVENTVNVSEDHVVCRLCLELVKDNSVIVLRNYIDIVQKLVRYFPELDLTCTEDPVICASCQVSLQHYFNFINNCLTTEEKIMEYCKVEGTNGKGQIDLNSMIHFISKDFLKCQFEIGEVKIEETCNEVSENASNNVEMKKEEILDVELDIKEDSSAQESELTDENSFQHHPPLSQSDCVPQNNRRYRLQEHILTHKGIIQEARYNCEKCPFKTKAKEYLRKHMLSHQHRKSTDVVRRNTLYKCDICDRKGKGKYNLKKHMLTHKPPSEVTMYKCGLCDYESKQKSHLKRHMLTHRSPSEITMYKCDLCDYEAKRKDTLKEHMLTHKPLSPSEITMYKCDLCDHKSKWRSGLKKHMLTHKSPSEITMYKCGLCDYETKYKDCLKQHMLVHMDVSEIEMHKCGVCPYETKWKTQLRKHLLTHRNRPVTMYKCYHCDYVGRMHYLQRHMLSHKTPSNTIYRCETCGYETKVKKCLKQHMLVHMDVSKIEMHKCKLCPFETKWRGAFRKHLFVHRKTSDLVMPVPMCKCYHCDYEGDMYSLRRHLPTHRTNTYKCETCAYETKNKNYLQKHMLNHMDVSKIEMHK